MLLNMQKPHVHPWSRTQGSNDGLISSITPEGGGGCIDKCIMHCGMWCYIELWKDDDRVGRCIHV